MPRVMLHAVYVVIEALVTAVGRNGTLRPYLWIDALREEIDRERDEAHIPRALAVAEQAALHAVRA